MIGSRSTSIGIALGLLMVAEPSRVMGQQVAANADVLFEQGRREMLQGDLASACDKLRRSDELDPAPGTKLNLGECEALRGRVATAWRLLILVERQLASDDVRLPIARNKREAVERRVPKLSIKLLSEAPADTRIRLGALELGAEELANPIALDPGRSELVISAAGHIAYRVPVDLEEGKTTHVVLQPPVPMASTTVPRPLARPPVTRPTSPHYTQKITPISAPSSQSQAYGPGSAILWVGVASVAAGSIAGLFTLDARRVNMEHCSASTQTCDELGRAAASRGRWLGALTTTGWILGGVGIGLGIYLRGNGRNASLPMTGLTLRSDASRSEVVLSQAY